MLGYFRPKIILKEYFIGGELAVLQMTGDATGTPSTQVQAPRRAEWYYSTVK